TSAIHEDSGGRAVVPRREGGALTTPQAQRMLSFYTAWKRACKEANLSGKLSHDFRRTAVKNLVRAGVPERVAMMITGPKTRDVFERYNIVSDGDLEEAARKIDERIVPDAARNPDKVRG